MKKVCSLVIAIMAFISCFIFTACGDKYKNLKMSFYSLEGDSLSEINLTIDDYDDINLERTRVAVRFDGISDKDIGNVDVKSSPLELADISNATLDGNKYYFDVTAVRANKGRLVVTHLASNKKVSIPLNINRKSNGLELKTDTYITKISNNDRQLILNAGQIVNLLPSNELCTDKVYFKSVTKNLPSGITFVEETVGENNFITGININSSVKNGSEIILYPVTVLQGYENTEYSAKTFKVKFVDEILESNTVISTDSYHKDYVNQEIILITNDFTTNTTTTGETYAYNNFNFELNYLLGDEVVGLGDIDGINYYDYYDIQFDYDRDLIYDPVLDGTKITIQAKDYMDASSVVIVRLQPKVAGDLSSIEKVIKIKGEVKPTDFNVTMQGKNIDISENIDLFNFYVSPNALGEVFTFSTIPDYALNSMQAMRIKISPALLNAKINVGDSIEGVNKVYTDDTFTNEFEGSSYTDGDNNIVYSFRNNKYVLEFYISTSAMKFYFDTDEKMLVSQLIYDTDSVYIRYSETNILTDEALSFNLTAVYDGDLLYLKDIRGVSRTLNFNHNEGIYDVKFNAGELQPKGVTYESSLYVDHNNIAYIVDDVYLDRKQGKNNLSANAYLLYLARENVIGEDLSPVSSAKLRIEVTGGNDNPLKIKQYSSVDGNGKNVTGSTLIEEFNYSATGGLNSIILLIFDQDTDIGEYTITLSSKNGYTKSIKCLVYEEISVEDLSFDIPTNDKLFKNDDFKLNYDCDYIVESGVKAELVLNVPNYAKNNILSYDFNATLNTDNVNSYIKLDTQTMQINSVLLTFLRGTYISYINDYITLTMSVNVPKYSNIIHQDGYNTLSISTKFFIYDKINDTDININHPTLTRYMSRYLGAYDVDDAKANLEVSVRDDNLWNYVQSYLQLPSSNLGEWHIYIRDRSTR